VGRAHTQNAHLLWCAFCF